MSRDNQNTPSADPVVAAPVVAAPAVTAVEPTAVPPVSSRGNLKVTFAYEVTTADGKARKPDSSASIPAPEASKLVHMGLARFESKE